MKKPGLFFMLFLFQVNVFAQAPTITLQPYANGFDNPVDIRHCNDSRLFIVEQDGFIKIVNNGTVLPTDFLNIDAIVGSNGNEEGLLGLAFHPEYKTNGYFYVYYTNNSGNIQISRFSVSAADSNIADAGSEFPLLTILHPTNSNHNGGSLHFGPDGYLYAGTGDGGGGGDPQNRAQNLQERLGKILRIDVDHGSPYSIPADNPFVNTAGAAPEIWSVGMRNPWRASFDRLTGDFWVGDVGQNQWEEINFEPSGSAGGVNYGWRCYEGTHPYNTTGCQPQSAYQDPVFEMSHSAPGNYCSVTGGYIYRGATYSDLYGCYFFSDYCNDMIQVLRSDGAGGFDHYTTVNFSGAGISAFGEDQHGEIYIADLFSGEIVKIESSVCGPVASFTTEDTLYICADSALLEMPFSPDHSYNWETPAGVAGGNGVWANQTGWYYSTVVNLSACIETDSTYVVLQGTPVPVSFTALDVSYCSNFNLPAVTLTGNPAGGVFSGVGVSGNTFDFNGVNEGDYSISYQYTDSNNCTSTSIQHVTITICMGIEQTESDIFMLQGRNPAYNVLDLNITSKYSGPASYSISDFSGRKVHSGSVNLTAGVQRLEIPLTAETGSYFLTLQSPESRVTYRFIWQGN